MVEITRLRAERVVVKPDEERKWDLRERGVRSRSRSSTRSQAASCTIACCGGAVVHLPRTAFASGRIPISIRAPTWGDISTTRASRMPGFASGTTSSFCSRPNASRKDAEIVVDYSTTIGDDDIWTMRCNCGRKSCRTTIRRFGSLPTELQRKYLRARLGAGVHHSDSRGSSGSS